MTMKATPRMNIGSESGCRNTLGRPCTAREPADRAEPVVQVRVEDAADDRAPARARAADHDHEQQRQREVRRVTTASEPLKSSR